MKKEDAIINAYKRFWIQLPEEAKEQALQNNGYIDHRFIGNEYGRLTNLLKMESKESYDVKFGEPTFIYRPKSLQGIENNNGWIKIDFNNLILPADGTEVNFYHQFINENGNQIEYHKGIFNSALGFTSYYDSENYKINEITHYHPIEKPKPPIY